MRKPLTPYQKAMLRQKRKGREIVIRCDSPEQKAGFQAQAQREGMSLNQWIIGKLLKESDPWAILDRRM